MSDLRKLEHLVEQLGEERFAALIDSGNTGKVKNFCSQLLKDAAIPTAMTIGGRTYDILAFLREGEEMLIGDLMVDRAKEMGANLGKDDGQYILDHQDEIPAALRGEVVFVFTSWRRPVGSESVCYVFWLGDCWVLSWGSLGRGWLGRDRVLRRKS